MTATATNRPASYASTATTVVALLALASVVRAAPAVELGGHETRPVARESSVLRAVAVAVAAARDLFGVDQTTLAAVGHANPAAIIPPRMISPADIYHAPAAQLGVALDERLLDLPPPSA